MEPFPTQAKKLLYDLDCMDITLSYEQARVTSRVDELVKISSLAKLFFKNLNTANRFI